MTNQDDQRRIEEAILVLRAQAGSDRAFERLFERYEERLLYYLRRVTGSADVADDAFGEAWLKAYRSIGEIRKPAAFRTWLYRVARNAAMDRLRDDRREVPLDDPGVGEAVAAASRQEEEPAFDDVDVADLNTGLQRIDGIHSEVLTLAFLEDLSYEEIATVLDVPIGTVRSRIHYGRRALRREIEAIRERRETNPNTGGER